MSISFVHNKELTVSPLKVEGFDDLDSKTKSLIYHLSMAGEYGNKLYYKQRFNKLNHLLITYFEKIYTKLTNNKDLVSDDLFDLFQETFMTYIFHNGVYHSYSGQKIEPLFSREQFDQLLSTIHNCTQNDCLNSENTQLLTQYLFDEITHTMGQEQTFYDKDITKEQIKTYVDKNYTSGKEQPEHAINSMFKLNDKGEIVEQKFKQNGLESETIDKIIEHLNMAMHYAENEKQALSIQHLVDFYNTGDPAYFDKHSIAWLQDNDSEVFYIHGFIETYLDPMKMCGSFESVVGFKNKEKTAIVEKITDNIQYFEDQMPVDKNFKKEKAVGLSASSIQVISSAGEAYPVLPLGICLPNSDWIREKHGSKSVNLANVVRDSKTKELVFNEFYLPEYLENLRKYSEHSSSLHTDLHEITGHGSGRTLPHVKANALGEYESVIEEARADLAALYHLADPKLIDMGIIPAEFDINQYAQTQYVIYLTNGLVNQLKRVQKGQNLKQTHMRNRQLISSWLINNIHESDMSFTTVNGKHFVTVNSVDNVRERFGILLSEIQRIKSEGDFEQAKHLVEKYGTAVNDIVHQEVIKRYEKLDLPSFIGFETPLIQPTNNNGETDYQLAYADNFIERSVLGYFPDRQKVSNE